MFTGLIETIGRVDSLHISDQRYRLKILTELAVRLNEGDSVAVNGLCLTVKTLSSDAFTADVMPETVRSSGVQKWRKGKIVNLERALPISGRLDGHLVSGHVDGIGSISSIQKEKNAYRITVQASPKIISSIIAKGSIALDGISLTVINRLTNSFDVGIIPHTYINTALHTVVIGDAVNIETDMIGKYVFAWLNNQSKTSDPKTLKDLLMAQGYLK